MPTATTPTALVALNLALFGSCENNTTSLSDAVQAFLQAPMKKKHGSLFRMNYGLTVGKPSIQKKPN